MTKKELIAALAEKTGESKATIGRILDAEKELILAETKAGREVKTALGKFVAHQTKEKMGVNPQNPSKKIKIPAKTVLKFKVQPSVKVLD